MSDAFIKKVIVYLEKIIKECEIDAVNRPLVEISLEGLLNEKEANKEKYIDMAKLPIKLYLNIDLNEDIDLKKDKSTDEDAINSHEDIQNRVFRAIKEINNYLNKNNLPKHILENLQCILTEFTKEGVSDDRLCEILSVYENSDIKKYFDLIKEDKGDNNLNLADSKRGRR